ncbi:bifunctional peptidase and arginyl-hydroxylase JMJD5 isoform X2 [Episyrphus balteatus]|uniref:bifunctional peptidase and arginyl-hydroxylase JMJD5 isoform X2 n=1 Tax=Episyrphus balteatus TaxID=286459 RepID=UPI0024863AC6|nr:bifunctional peptidase and arginyl-hydroxylase JMJD5 isoform X2 [Episyrphus balteatus]
MEKQIINLLNYLPNYEEIKHLTKDQIEANYILSMASENIQQILKEYQKSSNADLSTDEIEENSFLIESLNDKFWEHIHTGIFSEVSLETRKIYTISCYFKIAYSLISSHDQQQLEKCNLSQLIKLPYIDPIEHKEIPCDITILESPSVEEFKENHFIPLKPALLRGTINDWPALTKWRDLSYILKVAGNRTVPIEIGNNYTTDDWSQQLMKIRDFLQRQFGEKPPDNNDDEEFEVEYLAQHELFNHVPILKEDIICPIFCSLGEEPDKVDIKAWLGPKGTISPMHQDPKHNILCQVFGTKRIILASPDDSEYLYPHETDFFHNTSQIDADHLDLDEFPLARNAKFYHLTLQEGECLYLPPKWWHYIRSESKSFSVSFWWQ